LSLTQFIKHCILLLIYYLYYREETMMHALYHAVTA
jgi:hypothetical protein